jgi:GT2 family glycosyltransferase
VSAGIVAVVPSLGRSPVAAEALARLRAELAPGGGELLWVSPASAPPPLPLGASERWLALEREAGFAAAANRAFAASAAPWVALVNDDALVEPGWLAALAAALAREERLAAVQGAIGTLGAPARCDGCGVAWNSWWQAVQVGHGAPLPAPGAPAFEVFGVQATAALFRRAALERVAAGRARPFEEALGSWYEDVDLANRLRAAGYGALSVPAARALHLGSATGGTAPWRRRRLLARNRIAVVARLLGRNFPAALPRLALRDLVDGARAVVRLELGTASALAAGWLGAAALLPRFARAGRPLVARGEIARFAPALPIGSAG